MKLPNPLAVSKQEAYLAIKSGKLTQEQYDEVYKPSLLNPDNNFEAWLAKWCGLVESYPKDENNVPLCLCDEEALVAYLCGVKTTYPADHQNPMDVRLAAYLRYLINGIYGRPEYPVTTSEYWLSQMDAPNITNDTPSASFELNGTAEAPLLDLKAFGDTSQKTLSGKNLFNFGQFLEKKNEFTVSPDGSISVSDNKIVYSGHSGTGSQYYPSHEASNKNIYGMTNLEPNTTYTLSYKATGDTQAWVFFWNSSNARTSVNEVFSSNNPSMTFTTPADMSWYSVRIDNRTASNTITDIMLVRSQAVLGAPSTADTGMTITKSGNNITAAGTASQTWVNLTNNIPYGDAIYLPVGTEVTFCIDEPISCNLAAKFNKNGGGEPQDIIIQAGKKSVTTTISGNGPKGCILLYVGSFGAAGTNLNITVKNPRILLGDGTSFEPYTGGTASPNPDYPQDVNVVTGEQIIRTRGTGRNLFDPTDMTRMYLGYFEGPGTQIQASGQNTNNVIFWIPCKPNTNYCFRFPTSSTNPPIGIKKIGTTSSYPRKGAVMNKCSENISSSTEIYGAFLTDSDAKYLCVRIQGDYFLTNGGGYELTKNTLQITEGTTHYDYEEYNGRTDYIDMGKNLLPYPYYDSGSVSHNGVVFKTNEDGTVTLNGKNNGNGNSVFWILRGTQENLTLRAGRYYCTANGYGELMTLDTNGTYRPLSMRTGFTMELTEDTTITTIYIQIPKGSSFELNNYVFYPMLSLAPEFYAGLYSKPVEKVELCKIGNYQDKIYRDGNEWVLRKEVEHLSLPVSTLANNESYPGWGSIPNLARNVGIWNTGNFLAATDYKCSVTSFNNKAHNMDGPIGIGTNDNRQLLFLPRPFWGMDHTLTYWKTNYPNLVFDLYYGITKPEGITEEVIHGELADQLDAIVSGGTYEGYTAFTVESAGNNLPALLQVKAIPQVDPNAAENTRWYGAKKDPAEWTKTE